MIRVSRDFKPLLDDLSLAVARPQTAKRMILFFAAAILVVGTRTVSAVLRLLSLIEPVNPSTYHRLLSHRRWSQGTVLRMAPSLFLLYTIVVLFYDTMPQSSSHFRISHWVGKESVTLSDMIISVRQYLWVQWVFTHMPGGGAIQKLPPPVRKLIDFGLTQAA